MSVITREGGRATGQRDRHARHELEPNAFDGARPTGPGMSPAVLQRVAVLPPRDRAIVELTLSAKCSRSHIGRALGMAPGLVSRRLRVLYARLHDPLVVALFDPHCPL